MLLALDIGNTNVTMGAFDGDDLVASWRVATDSQRPSDEYALLLRDLLPMKGVAAGEITEVALCSVVPPLTSVFEDVARALFSTEPLTVGAGTRTGVRVMYDNPHDVGADRIADAAAALHFYGGPAIVVDLGTATVLDAVTADGRYLGGAIAVGIGLASDALVSNTSMLRRVDLAAPDQAIGKNTVAAIQSGLVYGFTGLVETMVRRFKGEMGEPAAKVVGTGGLVPLVAAETDIFDVVDQDLTLRGLQHIFTLNREAPSLALPRRRERGLDEPGGAG